MRKFTIVNSSTLYFVKVEGGGRVPNELEGGWTNYNDLQSRIDTYLKRVHDNKKEEPVQEKKTTRKKK